MDIDDVDPELRPALSRLPALDTSKRPIRLLTRTAVRLLRTHAVPGVEVEEVRDGPVRVRIYRPTSPKDVAGLLWIHGGGLVIGAPKQDDPLCATTAVELGITVVSVHYRLAPESPFPAALDDATGAWRWVQGNAQRLGIDPLRIAVGGESAGAGIAASLVQKLHDLEAVEPVAQWLFAPMLDDRTAAAEQLDAVDHPVWNNRANRFGWRSYLGLEPGSAVVPEYAVPARRGDLSGLPPTWIYSGDIELFHREIGEYAARLRAAGVDVEYEVVRGAVHGFENWARDTEPARRLLGSARAWLAEHLRRPDGGSARLV